jgi:hypothetical protein
MGRLKAYWTDGATWRGILYLLLRFPVGMATFVIAVTGYATALWFIAAPILAPLDTMDFGFWSPSSVVDGLALMPLGLVLLFASGWISEGMAAGSRALARWGAR